MQKDPRYGSYIFALMFLNGGIHMVLTSTLFDEDCRVPIMCSQDEPRDFTKRDIKGDFSLVVCI